MAAESEAPPDRAAIETARATLGDLVEETPVHRWRAAAVSDALGPESAVFLKLELFQRTGTFKARGALLNALALDEAARGRGVTAVSAGNHAIAVAFAAHRVGTSAKVVMMEGADPFRVAQVRRYGAELVQVPDVHAAFETVRAIEADEGRTFIHPFEGRTIALGTATVGLELARQVPALDAVIVPIGGGGLCAGVSCAIKTLQPNCRVYGVEPEGADTMHRSFAAGSPQAIDKVTTIADSLGAPYAQPYSFGLCRRYVDELVKDRRRGDAPRHGALVRRYEARGGAGRRGGDGGAARPARRPATGPTHGGHRLRYQHRRTEIHETGAVRLNLPRQRRRRLPFVRTVILSFRR